MASQNSFANLSTEKFRLRMRPHAVSIYQSIWPGCKVEDLRQDGVKVHVLDKHFGIDTLATFKSGQWVSIQEKYRENIAYTHPGYRVRRECPDFTQEHMNGYQTEWQSEGEWFHLGAQLYFYGWAASDESRFIDWIILDIPKYKLLVERKGGLNRIGQFGVNRRYGKASFYKIPILELTDAIVLRKSEHDASSIANMIRERDESIPPF